MLSIYQFCNMFHISFQFWCSRTSHSPEAADMSETPAPSTRTRAKTPGSNKQKQKKSAATSKGWYIDLFHLLPNTHYWGGGVPSVCHPPPRGAANVKKKKKKTCYADIQTWLRMLPALQQKHPTPTIVKGNWGQSMS